MWPPARNDPALTAGTRRIDGPPRNRTRTRRPATSMTAPFDHDKNGRAIPAFPTVIPKIHNVYPYTGQITDTCFANSHV
jgi:hypothetical protein